jgi:hypothetical protein
VSLHRARNRRVGTARAGAPNPIVIASPRALAKRIIVYAGMPGGPLPMTVADDLIRILRLQDV